MSIDDEFHIDCWPQVEASNSYPALLVWIMWRVTLTGIGLIILGLATVMLVVLPNISDSGWPVASIPMLDDGSSGDSVRETLFVVSSSFGGGRVTALGAGTMREQYSIDIGSDPDAVISPDGTRLYAANTMSLAAYDTDSGDELWRTPIEGRVRWHLGAGPSTLAVSSTGDAVYVYSLRKQYTHWVQIFDADTGQKVSDTEAYTGYCPARLHVSSDGEMMYLPCQNSTWVRTISLSTGQDGEPLPLGAKVAGSTWPAGGSNLYVVTRQADVVVIEMEDGSIKPKVSLDGSERRIVPRGLFSVSGNGEKLFVGFRTEQLDNGSETAGEIVMYDTSTWEEISRVRLGDTPVSGWSLSPGSFGSVYGVHHRYADDTGRIVASEVVKIEAGGNVTTRLLAGEEVWRLIVADTVE